MPIAQVLLAFVEWGLANLPTLIQAGVTVAPLIGNVKTAIDALVSGNHITDDQAAALRAQTTTIEAQWAEVEKAAEAEVAAPATPPAQP